MGQPWPEYADPAGDEPTRSLYKNQPTVLASIRGTQKSKRLETDADGNAYVRIAVDDSTAGIVVSPLASGTVSSVPASTLTTITTYTAASDTKLSKISVSGTIYAKYQLFLDTVLIDTKRCGPEREMDFMFDRPLSLSAISVLDVKVTHYQTGSLEEFNATVYGA